MKETNDRYKYLVERIPPERVISVDDASHGAAPDTSFHLFSTAPAVGALQPEDQSQQVLNSIPANPA